MPKVQPIESHRSNLCKQESFSQKRLAHVHGGLPLFLAKKGNDPDTEVDWDIPEANRPREVRGCCSEAIRVDRVDETKEYFSIVA